MKKWVLVTLEEAKAHPLYGIHGWLLLLTICFGGNLLAQLNAAAEAVQALPAAALPSLGGALCVGVPFFAILTKHRRTRWIATFGLLLAWPVVAALAMLFVPTDAVARAVMEGLAPWALALILAIPYLHLSRRVRVTFEEKVRQ